MTSYAMYALRQVSDLMRIRMEKAKEKQENTIRFGVEEVETMLRILQMVTGKTDD